MYSRGERQLWETSSSQAAQDADHGNTALGGPSPLSLFLSGWKLRTTIIVARMTMTMKMPSVTLVKMLAKLISVKCWQELYKFYDISYIM